ncbi:MAG: PAS domain S-box protein [Planctomyces sp.]|nr:PAS domain S-box protein [Planctomyces sp.]
MESVFRIFDTEGFPKRWECGPNWIQEPGWGWLHIVSDVAIWAAYMAIPIVLISLVRNRRDIPFSRVFWLFGAFIFACGLTHLLDAGVFWWPAYRFTGLVKLATAAVSWGTVVALMAIVPKALALQGPVQLEAKVQQRTQELQLLNARLKGVVARSEVIEHALRDREEQLRLVLEAGRMGTWEWQLQNDLVRIDGRVQRLFGIDAEDGVVHIERVFDAIHAEDRDRIRAAVDRTIHRNDRYDEEFRSVHSDGSIVWLAGRGDVVRDAAGRPSRMIGVTFEITERRQADEQLLLRDRALQSATNGIIIADAHSPDLPIIYANHAFEILTGYPASEVLGRNCRFLQGPKTDPRAVERVRQALERKVSCHVTLLNYRRDGTPFWNDIRITPLRNAAGEVTHFVGVQGDVTERHEFEETLKSAGAMAQAASDAKSEFLANMSHEIRTPLTAVLGCADTLYPRLDKEEHREMLQMIRNQGRMLLGILNDILDLSKIEAGRLEIHPESCSIIAVIEEVRALLASQAAEKGLELSVRYESQMPSEMQTDPLRVRQILMNLVGNAIKFTDAGSVAVVVDCDRRPFPPILNIHVVDTGIGIPADRLEAVFEAFSQLGNYPSRRVGGTGLGLTICQRLVRMLDGQIGVESQLGKGTHFTVSLPVHSDQPLRFVASAGLAEQADEQHRSRDSINVVLPIAVLVAEDTRGIQFMIRRMLEDAGAMVAVVDNGERAVEEVLRAAEGAQPFDIVLMDMQMPVMNGFEATSRLRELGSRVPIIALTAAAMQGDRERCLKAGCDDYLSKPVDRHALLEAILRQYNRVAGVR